MLAPILLAAALSAASPAEHAAACAGKTGWSDPAPPVRLPGTEAFLVGTCGITVVLVVDPEGAGLVLIDTGPAEAAPTIQRNIEALGYKITDVKLMLATHEHLDHVGGMKALQEASGAEIRLSPKAAAAIGAGAVDPDDPQSGAIAPPPAARIGRVLSDGETIRLGWLRLTAHFTPGHSPGGTSWTWPAAAGGALHRVVYADSLSAVSNDSYRFTDHPDRVSALRASISWVGAQRCDVLLTPHPASSALFERIHADRLRDRGACKAYAQNAAKALEARLVKEK